MAFMIIVAPAAIIITLFFTAIIITTWVVIRAGSMSNVVLELPISFFGVCNLEEFADGLGSLAVKFGAQLLMVMESSCESGDGLAVPNVGDGVPCLGEVPNVAS